MEELLGLNNHMQAITYVHFFYIILEVFLEFPKHGLFMNAAHQMNNLVKNLINKKNYVEKANNSRRSVRCSTNFQHHMSRLIIDFLSPTAQD
mmetsp:Transcript_37742/g.87890  ORF Transcript_37742/g.87890 Transcript_37742/m.87890 type:complete len:92 (+) Transcript_37742:1322-1597(+)